MKKKNHLLSILMVCLVFAAGIISGCTPKQDVPDYYAEEICFEEIKTGDYIVIAGDKSEEALSRLQWTKGLDHAVIRGETVNDKRVLNYISDNTEVFRAEVTENGMLFQGEKGYLGVSEGDKAIRFLEEPMEGCYWNRTEEGKLRVLAPGNDGEKNDVYLGYYYKYGIFSGFYKKADGTPPGVESYSFYRTTDAWADRDQYADGYRLKMFQTSDIHGVISYDDGTNWQLRMAKISWIVNQARSIYGEKRNDRVILLDGGDMYQGSLFSTLLGWQPISAIFDTMEYDAVGLGNHEFDKGLNYAMDSDGTMMDYTRNGTDYVNEIPYVMCNLYQNGEKVKGLREYVILDKTAVNDSGEELPVKIGVIGFGEDYSGSVNRENYTEAGYEIREDYAFAMSLAERLKKEEGCDAVILLAHGDSSKVAENLSEGCEVDLVLGGHLHTFKHGENSWGLKYASPGNKADSIVNANFVFRKENGKTVLKAVQNVYPEYITGNPETLYDAEENLKTMDREVYVIGNDYLVLLGNMLNIKIGYITTPVLRYTYLPGSRKRSTTAGNWIASIIQRAGEADIGFINSGGLRQDYYIPEGKDRREISAGDIYTMFPFDNEVLVFELTYEELLTAFEYAISDGGWGLLARMVGIDCHYDSLSEERQVFSLVTYDGETIYDHGVWKDGWKEKKVTVAMLDFCAETDRVSSTGLHNPFVEWEKTDRLIRGGIDEADAAMKVLTAEAEEKDGLLEIDTRAHLLEEEASSAN